LSNTYGLTEVAPDLTIFEPDEFREAIKKDLPHRASVGKPNVFVDLKIIGSDGNEVASGESGDLWARGPNIMKGYLNLPEQTAEVLVDGWFHTGDVARFDENGYVYLLDRTKDMIITGGENVYSTEVENVLYKHPDIMECAVIGVTDKKMGEKLMAVVVRRPDTDPTPEDIIAHCREVIGGYKIPRLIEFVDAMPKNAMGKILKNKLRNIYSQ
jgi:long-chain acyl-CoA synthetase